MNEVWKDVIGYEGLYQVSNHGRVRSLGRIDSLGRAWADKMLKQINNGRGYKHVNLHKYGKSKTYGIHRLVAEAFIPNPENKPQVHHINHDRLDNRVENLEWVTQSEQCDSNWLKLHSGKNYAGPKKTVFIDGVEYWSQTEAAKELGISRPRLSNAINNGESVYNGRNKIYKLG